MTAQSIDPTGFRRVRLAPGRADGAATMAPAYRVPLSRGRRAPDGGGAWNGSDDNTSRVQEER